MNNYCRGFTFIEVLVCSIILGIAIFGYLSIDRNSRQLLNKSKQMQSLQYQLNELNDIIQSHGSKLAQRICPACDSLHSANNELQQWQETFNRQFPNTDVKFSIVSHNTIKATFCSKNKPCDDIFVTV